MKLGLLLVALTTVTSVAYAKKKYVDAHIALETILDDRSSVAGQTAHVYGEFLVKGTDKRGCSFTDKKKWLGLELTAKEGGGTLYAYCKQPGLNCKRFLDASEPHTILGPTVTVPKKACSEPMVELIDY